MGLKKIVVFESDQSKIFFESLITTELKRESGFIASESNSPLIKATHSLQSSLEPVVAFAKAFVSRVNESDFEAPAQVELEFGIKLSGEVDFWVISGTGEGTINIKLSWHNKDKQ